MASFTSGRRCSPSSKGRKRFIPQDRRTKPKAVKTAERRHCRDEVQEETAPKKKVRKVTEVEPRSVSDYPIIRVHGAIMAPIERTEEAAVAEAAVAEAIQGRPE